MQITLENKRRELIKCIAPSPKPVGLKLVIHNELLGESTATHIEGHLEHVHQEVHICLWLQGPPSGLCTHLTALDLH